MGVVWCGDDSRIATGGAVEGIGGDGLIVGGSLVEVYVAVSIFSIFVSVIDRVWSGNVSPLTEDGSLGVGVSTL